MSIINNLETRGVIDREETMRKTTTNSKFKSYRKTQEDRVRAAIRTENMGKDQGEELDPYSRASTKRNSTKVMQLTHTGYQTTLLEKILQSQNNPELTANNMQFQQKTLDLLVEVKDALNDIRKGQGSQPERQKREEIKKREVSDLARDIAEMNIGGIMNHMKSSVAGGADKYGIFGMLGSVKEMVASTLESGMFGEIVKDSFQSAILSAFGANNKVKILNYKNDPMQAIQDMINLGGLSSNPVISKLLSPFMTAQKLDPTVAENKKDINGAAVFDHRTHTTINTVIPDLLSRLVAQTEGKERMKFDHDKQQWVTVSQILDSYSSKDTASKYTKDLINKVRTAVTEGANADQGSRAYQYVQRDKDNKVVKNSDNKAVFKNDQAFITVMSKVAKSGCTLSELMGATNIGKLISKYKLSGDGVDENTAAVVIAYIQDGLRNANQVEYNEIDHDMRERVSKLNNMKEYSDLTMDIDSAEIEAYRKVKEGRSSYKDAVRELYGKPTITGMNAKGNSRTVSDIKTIRTSPLSADDKNKMADRQYKNISADKRKFGTVESQMSDYKISTRGYEATPEELDQIRYDQLRQKKLITEKEYKAAIDGNMSPKVKAKVEMESKRMAAAWQLFATFDKAKATSWGMAELSGEPAGKYASEGFFSSPDDCIQHINEDGTINMASLRARNSKFTDAYVDNLRDIVKKSEEQSFNFDISNPMESANEVLNGIFTDPSLAKKLGMGTGSVAGYAIGKMINNHTFIKNPKLGYLLGAVGAGIMSMERTQHYLNQTLGPAGTVENENGFSNREILIAKLFNKWLPAAGIGGKAAQLTYKFMSKMGPAGMMLGPVASLAIGGTVAAMTPGLIKVGKKMLFDDDGKGNKGILKSIGRGLRSIPAVNDIFGGAKDNRSDEEVLDATMNQLLKNTNERIHELEQNPKKTDAEWAELKKLNGYRNELLSGRERLQSIIKTDDNDTRKTEYSRFQTEFLDKHEDVQQNYHSEIVKRNRRNTLGDASEAKITIKSKDELAKLYAKKAMQKFDGVDIEKLTDAEKKEYDTFSAVANGKSASALFERHLKKYLEKEGDGIENLAESLYEGDSLVTKLGYSTVHTGWKDDKGNNHKGLMQLESKEEFDDWLNSLNERSRKYVEKYIAGRRTLYGLRDNLKEIAGLTIDSTIPGLGPRDREVAIERLIKSEMMKSGNIVGFLSNKLKVKKKDITNKVLSVFDAGGVDSDSLRKEGLYANKIESLMGGGQGSGDVNELVKMRDLSNYKFKNGSKLSVAGCSIAALNNALNILHKGGVSINYLIEIANSYLSSDGGVTSDFFKDVADRLSIQCKRFNSVDNEFTNDMLAKFNPKSGEAVVLLLKNAHGDGSHYVNLRTVGSTKAIIDDPEVTGVTNVSTSTLVLSLLEVIVLKDSIAKDIVIENNPKTSYTPKPKSVSNISSFANPNIDISHSTVSNSNHDRQTNIGEVAGNVPSKGAIGDGILNVRIVEDLTLPMVMSDKEAAMSVARNLRNSTGSSKVSTAYMKKVEQMRKQQGVMKEYIEAQKTQDNIQRTADAIEGVSTGAGGAGTGVGEAEVTDKKKDHDGFFSPIATLGKTISAMIAGAVGVGLGELMDSFKNSLDGFFNSKNYVDENGDKHGADTGGHFADMRSAGISAKNLLKLGKNAIKFTMSKSKDMAFGMGKSLLTTADKAKDAAQTAKNLKNADVIKDTLVKSLKFLGDFPDKIMEKFIKLADKIPGMGKRMKAAFTSKGGKKIWTKIAGGLKTFISKFSKFAPSNIAKAAWKAVPGLSILLSLGGAVMSFWDGYNNAEFYFNKPPEEISFLSKIFNGCLKSLYDELPNFICSILSLIPFVGPVIGFIAPLVIMYLDSEYGGYEKFLEFLGLRDMSEIDENNNLKNDKLTTTTDEGDLAVKLSEKHNISANLDKDKAKVKNDDGTYNFTKDSTKNANANEVYSLMKDKAKAKGVNVSMAMSQWANESAWGTSATLNQDAAKENNVLFGIKKGSDWKGKTVKLMTTEYIKPDQLSYWSAKEGFEVLGESNGLMKIRCYDDFRAYDSKDAAVDDYLNLIQNNYSNGLDGYFTDPNGFKTIQSLMEQNFNIDEVHQMYAEAGRNANIDPTYQALASGFALPLDNPDYKITSAFGMRKLPNETEERLHKGIDFAGKKNDPIKSIGDGEVVYVGDEGHGGGTQINIKHANGTVSKYLHLNGTNVKKGDQVKTGQLIGAMGSSGGNYKDHLHLSVMKGKEYVDPLLALGLDPGRLKLDPKTDAENFKWLSRNQGYVDKYKTEITRMAEVKTEEMKQQKLAQETSTKPTSADLGKGGPTTEYTKAPDVTSNSSSDQHRITILEQQNRDLLKAMETMNKLLGAIVKNTEINSNNIMNDAMMLSR